jgi:hypothetical protein
MRTARTLEAEWRNVLRGSVSTGAKEDESSTGSVWAAGFQHVTACSRWERVLNLWTLYFYNFPNFPGPRWTADTESVNTGSRLHLKSSEGFWEHVVFFISSSLSGGYIYSHIWSEDLVISMQTLSDPMSDLARHYDFPVSDAFLDL